jgi:molybdopterin molybdotransferase
MARRLIELDEARQMVSDSAGALPGEVVELRAALDRILAADVVGEDAVPAFDNSAMDGFALRAADIEGATRATPASLRVIGESRAGCPAAGPVGPGQAIAISTGAMMPEGADAVIPIEETAVRNATVAVFAPADAGAYVRRAGDDIAPGQRVLARGMRLGPAELGVLASLGKEDVLCTRRPRVSVFTTGDELVAPGAVLRAGAVRDSNSYSIPALARRAGAEVIDVTSIPDDAHAIKDAIAGALALDVVIVCGGASVGEHDHLKDALAALDVRERFWGVALKPGKPTWFGVYGQTLVFGLPGNPVSAMVTFILLVAPALRALSAASAETVHTTATLTSDYDKSPGRAHAVRCSVRASESGWEVQPTGPQGSHILSSMLGAQALAIIPGNSGPLSAGSKVQIEMLWPFAG